MFQTVAIAGVGLIGGSFALALRRAGFAGRILGVSSARTIERALELRVIDAGATLEAACREADLVYLAGPIHSILETLPRLSDWLKPEALVTDAGSTKGRICEAAAGWPKGQFLGGHPMAGKEVRGVEAAEAALFEGRPYLLTPTGPEQFDTAAARELVDWVEKIGAIPHLLSPADHDRIVSLSSHLPQMLSTALAATLGRDESAAEIAAAAGPGLVDSTRLALSAWEIWRDILDTNQPAILEAMDRFAAAWQEVRNDLASGKVERDFVTGAAFARYLRERR
ncbi:MAG: prephenate dehydrogenase/arogenate dehydrogenase family protein [Acidobacteria bacterium]|nr:prephenate dehydrogenase/arogenate dehydrogenase family protein [Acidobacteriota bacterium]